MGYLGLDETVVKDDNMFQRLFWPSDHAGEADALGKQGFWLCLWIAVSSSAVTLYQGHWLIAVLVLVFYGLGGIGVREHSQPAAMLVATAYLIEMVGGVILLGRFPGFLGIAALILLIGNVRGTYIAAKWAAQDADAMPDRYGETITDELVDRMPARVWPKAKIPFFCAAVLYMCLTIASTVMLAMRPAQPVSQDRTGEIEVKP